MLLGKWLGWMVSRKRGLKHVMPIPNSKSRFFLDAEPGLKIMLTRLGLLQQTQFKFEIVFGFPGHRGSIARAIQPSCHG